ncbi:MAG: hypothetical protein UT48_C0004G0010 [Parcubacteria group bacterium GW2011_GWE2_39_37]|uniref:Prepilin-type N-terminal cleavage/methylation domain-containing protein n=1 Tax=Candidatus Falkowbacteria bacterium GW2011_GWF2_39_8 TaxID=1618642 RepID=A0A0G0PSP4_9BACT|nr:MAG: hypothetical protein UT48_C0004G0010 [Parcubacteria group bacterium GW2011_GWE2_39_37]KKR31179.1 MAG: hypothetical protein UT64_C0070G0007 [Candidatus Falkowbacteria bacterium GW2011_GWF2_39_8]
MSIKNNKRGFSLLELITAFSILGLVTIALLQAFPFGLAANREAENNSVASYLAQQKIEDLGSVAYSDLNVGVIEPKNSIPNYPGFQRQSVVSYVDGNLNEIVSDLDLKKISTTVYYTSPQSQTEKIFNLTTLVSKK